MRPMRKIPGEVPLTRLPATLHQVKDDPARAAAVLGDCSPTAVWSTATKPRRATLPRSPHLLHRAAPLCNTLQHESSLYARMPGYPMNNLRGARE